MSNTQQFNNSVRARPSRSLRGPSHGLCGNASSQRKASTRRSATQSLRLSQVNAERDKGAAAEARRTASKTPAIIEQQDYPTPMDNHFNYNAQNYDSADWDNNPDWAAPGNEGEAEDEVTKALKEIQYTSYDFYTRRDRTQISNAHWAPQLNEMVDAYMDFCLKQNAGGPPEEGKGEGAAMMLEVIDIFGTEFKLIPSSKDKWQSAALVRSGIIPTAPLIHNRGITVCTVNLYHKLFVRCPRLGIQSFAKCLCDFREKAFKPYLSTKLYAAFDVYVAILQEVHKHTKALLGREGREWRMLNACLSCQYRLKEEDKQEVRMLMAMDGNDSLKRVEHKEDVLQEQEEAGKELPPALKEQIDR